MSYTDEDGYTWEGAVINCLDCTFLENIQNNGKCNSYDTRAYYCWKYHLCEHEIRKKFGVSIVDQINCNEWRPK
jgi:hypothetical protein